jgi:hypothetical protein
MSLTSFLTALFEDGCVLVPQERSLPDDDRRDAESLLAEFESTCRVTLPGSPPAFHMETALAAAEMLYHACRCLVYRNLDPAGELASDLKAGSVRRVAADHYSADVVYRYLPDLWRLTRELPPNDPLAPRVQDLATRWPLSSVGIDGLPPLEIDEFAGDSSLLLLYIDRIAERKDRSRLNDPRIRDALRSVCGLYPDLIPELTSAIADHSQTPGNPA